MRVTRLLASLAVAAGLVWAPSAAAAPEPPARKPVAGLAQPELAQGLAEASSLARLHSLLVARDGETVLARRFAGPPLDEPVNVKSVSKTVLATLVGQAIARGYLDGPQARLGDVLGARIPDEADPAVREITVGHLLSMQAGLARTSGAHYGDWVASDDWVAHALSRPMRDEPGGAFIYSTGNSHILSAVLTKVTGRSTLALARSWLGEPLGMQIPPWTRDPQGLYMGGNNMRLSPRGLVAFAEMYRRGGVYDGKRVLSRDWIVAAWQPRGRSRYTGDGYGYGWFSTTLVGARAFYARGYGGQMVYVLPELDMTVVMTAQASPPSDPGFARRQHALLAQHLIPAARTCPLQAGERKACREPAS